MIYIPPWQMKKRAKIEDFLTFSSPSAFSISVTNPGWDGTMEYSTDASTWDTWHGTEISGVLSGEKYVLYFRGTGNSKITGDPSGVWSIAGTNIACNGAIDLLLDYATVKSGNHPTMAEGCYDSMFSGCTSLTAAPSLPATTLTDSCYYSMFQGCTGIKLSSTASGTYTKSYRIPKNGTGTTASGALNGMFANTGGTFKGTPEINTTYYLDESNTIV